MSKTSLIGYLLNWEFLATKSPKKQQKMSEISSTYKIPGFITDEEPDMFSDVLGKTEEEKPFDLYEELSAISEEIEKCRSRMC